MRSVSARELMYTLSCKDRMMMRERESERERMTVSGKYPFKKFNISPTGRSARCMHKVWYHHHYSGVRHSHYCLSATYYQAIDTLTSFLSTILVDEVLSHCYHDVEFPFHHSFRLHSSLFTLPSSLFPLPSSLVPLPSPLFTLRRRRVSY